MRLGVKAYLNHGIVLLGDRPVRVEDDIVPRHAEYTLQTPVLAADGYVVTDKVTDLHIAAVTAAVVDEDPVAEDVECGQHRGPADADGEEELRGYEVGCRCYFESSDEPLESPADAERLCGCI
jgi:hypothetical protein